jgi:hypothetical protein
LGPSPAGEFDPDPPAEGVSGDVYFLQAQAVELLFDAVSKGLNRRRNLLIKWRTAGVAVQRRHDHFVVWFQIGQQRGPCPPDGPDPVQQQ